MLDDDVQRRVALNCSVDCNIHIHPLQECREDRVRVRTFSAENDAASIQIERLQGGASFEAGSPTSEGLR